jgi:hypothetical protein
MRRCQDIFHTVNYGEGMGAGCEREPPPVCEWTNIGFYPVGFTFCKTGGHNRIGRCGEVGGPV